MTFLSTLSLSRKPISRFRSLLVFFDHFYQPRIYVNGVHVLCCPAFKMISQGSLPRMIPTFGFTTDAFRLKTASNYYTVPMTTPILKNMIHPTIHLAHLVKLRQKQGLLYASRPPAQKGIKWGNLIRGSFPTQAPDEPRLIDVKVVKSLGHIGV